MRRGSVLLREHVLLDVRPAEAAEVDAVYLVGVSTGSIEGDPFLRRGRRGPGDREIARHGGFLAFLDGDGVALAFFDRLQELEDKHLKAHNERLLTQSRAAQAAARDLPFLA